MTNEEKQEIVSAVLSALRTNSVLITDLTEIQDIPDGAFIELSGGRRINAVVFRQVIGDEIATGVVTPLITAERTQRQDADNTLGGRLDVVENSVENLGQNKFDKANVVESSGNSPMLVMSQGYVTLLVNGINVRLSNVRMALGTVDENRNLINFTNADGQTSYVTINKASTTKAGLMSAGDKSALEQYGTDIEALQESKVDGVSAELDDDSATIVVTTHGENDEDFEVLIPKAGTIPTGETDPVAGVMSAEQAKDLDDVVLQVFPLTASFTSSNAGAFEKGQTVTPAATISVTRRGTSVLSEASFSTPMTVNGNALSYEPVTENTTLNVSVSHKGSSVALPALRYLFYNYVYGDVLSAVPGDIAEAIAASSTLVELSSRTTIERKLAANKLFLFAVPGNVSLVCRHVETGSVIPCTVGTALVPRKNDGSVTDSYSYIIVPKSDIEWNFKITNT